MDAEQRAQRAVRRQRVERAGLEPCDVCGGAEKRVDDETLACTCDADRAQVVARAARLAHKHLDGRDGDRGDRIAP